MDKYSQFACPIYDERLPIIVTDKDTIEALNNVLTTLYEYYEA